MNNEPKESNRITILITIFLFLISVLLLLGLLNYYANPFWLDPKTTVRNFCNKIYDFPYITELFYEEPEKSSLPQNTVDMTDASFSQVYAYLLDYDQEKAQHSDLYTALCQNTAYISYEIVDCQKTSAEKAKVSVSFTYRAFPYDFTVANFRDFITEYPDNYYQSNIALAQANRSDFSAILTSAQISKEMKSSQISFYLERDSRFDSWEVKSYQEDDGMPSLTCILFADLPLIYDAAIAEANEYWAENPPKTEEEAADEEEEEQEKKETSENNASSSESSKKVSGGRFYGEEDSTANPSSGQKNSSSLQEEESDYEPDYYDDGFEEYYDSNKDYYNSEEDAYDDYEEDEWEWEE